MHTITLTSKGQVTLPADFRKALHLQDGDKLLVTYHPASRSLILRKPMTIDELSASIGIKIKRKVKPITNVDEYYQTHKGVPYE